VKTKTNLRRGLSHASAGPPPGDMIGAAAVFSAIDLSKVKTGGGLHGFKIGNEIGQMIFAGPAEAISFAQRLRPVRGGDRIEIVPVAIVEREHRR
jgi:hypothetical protein